MAHLVFLQAHHSQVEPRLDGSVGVLISLWNGDKELTLHFIQGNGGTVTINNVQSNGGAHWVALYYANGDSSWRNVTVR